MVKINRKIIDLLLNLGSSNIGYYSKYGAVIGDAEFIIYYNDEENVSYLAHISEFDTNGIFIKLKDTVK
jgi:hypothetical protein